MKYYVMTIEQYTPKDAEGKAEQAKVEKKNTLDSALSHFYGVLKTASDSDAHNFLDAKIVQSDGGVVKRDTYGKYADEEV